MRNFNQFVELMNVKLFIDEVKQRKSQSIYVWRMPKRTKKLSFFWNQRDSGLGNSRYRREGVRGGGRNQKY